MKTEYLVLLGATVLAAAGQLLFKVGATGREHWKDMINVAVLGGLTCYGIGTLAWIFALSRLPLRVVYPYTALTFVLVYVGAIVFFGEKLHGRSMVGVACVLLGLFLLTTEQIV